jgi:hypothetical protein
LHHYVKVEPILPTPTKCVLFDRVTNLDEFSPNLREPNVLATFSPRNKSCINFDEKWVWLHCGRVARFLLVQHTKMGKIPNNHKNTKWSQNLPNGRKIFHHLPLQDPPKLTQIVIFGLKYAIWQPCIVGDSFTNSSRLFVNM